MRIRAIYAETPDYLIPNQTTSHPAVHLPGGLFSCLHFFYDAICKPDIVEFNGTKYAYVHNLQGDIVAILDSDGTAVVQYKYDAWGRQIDCTFETGNDEAEALSTLNPFRYRGYVYDEETGLYYLRSRYNNPCWSRLVNADILYKWNLFAYCLSEPIKNIDVDGYDPGVSFAEMGFGNPMAHISGGGCNTGSGRSWEPAKHFGITNESCNDDGRAEVVDELLDTGCRLIIRLAITALSVKLAGYISGVGVSSSTLATCASRGVAALTLATGEVAATYVVDDITTDGRLGLECEPSNAATYIVNGIAGACCAVLPFEAGLIHAVQRGLLKTVVKTLLSPLTQNDIAE